MNGAVAYMYSKELRFKKALTLINASVVFLSKV